MSWSYNDSTCEISMTEGDWGVALPFTLSGVTVSDSDEFTLQVKKTHDGEEVLTKTFSAENNGFNLVISENETSRLSPGKYVYCLDWKQEGNFNYNLVRSAVYKVGDKA